LSKVNPSNANSPSGDSEGVSLHRRGVPQSLQTRHGQPDRWVFSGSLDKFSDDVKACAKIGAHEVFFNPTFSPEGQSLDYWLSLLDQLQGMMSVS
jgi:hypothetical protein